jgi:hypothetical protein
MPAKRLSERPPYALLSWSVAYEGEPRKGAPAVDVDIWIPKEVIRRGISDIANYAEGRMGWKVHRNDGWSGGGLMLGPEELSLVCIKVRAREIRAALA